MIKVGAYGPQPAKILLVGEAPGKNEEEFVDPITHEIGRPFVGASGQELTKMLNEAGILRTEVRVTNVCKFRPPKNDIELWWELKTSGKQKGQVKHIDERILEGLKELDDEIRTTRPNCIVPMGNLPLWALTGSTGITKWRSSLLELKGVSTIGKPFDRGTKLIPTIHPAAVLRKWDWRYLVCHDLRRVKRWSEFTGFPDITEHFLVASTFQQVVERLEWLLARVHQGSYKMAVDIETKRQHHLACFGIAWSKEDAICIPFWDGRKPGGSYWSREEECTIVLLLRDLLTHPNARCVGQNWQYDYQYVRKWWGFEVNLWLDCMSEHHTQFPGLSKGLDFQSSLYADIHVYWKDEGKEQGHGDPLVWWTYNCRDCVRTYEIAEVLISAREQRGLRATKYGSPHEIQQRLSIPVARASARGVKVDLDLRKRIAFMLQANKAEAEQWLCDVLRKEAFNARSPKQLQELFYDELNTPKILHRKTRKPTLDDETLDIYSRRYPLLRPLCQGINHVRSLGTAISVCLQSLDYDRRLRCQYNIPGTETYRFSSSTDPFGFGGNLQNITDGSRSDADYPLPNLRKFVIPDTGCTIGEFDLPQADARVVAWEAEDEHLIELLLDPERHLHLENAELIFGKRPLNKGEINYYYAKQGVHLTNYGGTPGVLAKTLGLTVHEADIFQKKWFGLHPKIKQWHNRVQMQLATSRRVENKYGYQRFYFDRIEELLKEALAWIPQSTVAVATNLGVLAVDADPYLRKMGVEFLLQVHDSAVFQWPTRNTNLVLPLLAERMTVDVPYDRNLRFQGGAKISDKSWGDVQEVKVKLTA